MESRDLTLQIPRHRLQRAPRCLQPLSEKDLATRRIGNVVFWHSSAWPSSLRPSHVAVTKEVPLRLEETLKPVELKHTFVIGEPKQAEVQQATLRLEEEDTSSSSSSSSSSMEPKQKLAKSCLKPWRSVEMYKRAMTQNWQKNLWPFPKRSVMLILSILAAHSTALFRCMPPGRRSNGLRALLRLEAQPISAGGNSPDLGFSGRGIMDASESDDVL